MQIDDWTMGLQEPADVARFCEVDPNLLRAAGVTADDWLRAVLEVVAGVRTHSVTVRSLVDGGRDSEAMRLVASSMSPDINLDSAASAAADLAWSRIVERSTDARLSIEKVVRDLATSDASASTSVAALCIEAQALRVATQRPDVPTEIILNLDAVDRICVLAGEAMARAAEAARSKNERASMLHDLSMRAAAALVNELAREDSTLRFRASVILSSLADLIMGGQLGALERIAARQFDDVPHSVAGAQPRHTPMRPPKNGGPEAAVSVALSAISTTFLRNASHRGRSVTSHQGLREARIEVEHLSPRDQRDRLLAHALATEVPTIRHALLAEALGREGERYLFEREQLRFAKSLLSDAIACSVVAAEHSNDSLLDRCLHWLLLCHAWSSVAPWSRENQSSIVEFQRDPALIARWISERKELTILADAWVAEPLDVSRELMQLFHSLPVDGESLHRLLAETLLRPGPLAAHPERTISKALDLSDRSTASAPVRTAFHRIGQELASPESGQLVVAARNHVLRRLDAIETDVSQLCAVGGDSEGSIVRRLLALLRKHLDSRERFLAPRLTVAAGISRLFSSDRNHDIRIPLIVQNAEGAAAAQDIDVALRVDNDSLGVVHRMQPRELPLGTLEPGDKKELAFFCDIHNAELATAVSFHVDLRQNFHVLESAKFDVGLIQATRRGKISPYQPGVPLAKGEGFVGRQQHLKTIADALLADAAVRVPLVVGIRRVGKTSILYALQRDERIQRRYATRYLSFEDRDESHTTAQFLLRLAEEMRAMLEEIDGRAASQAVPFSRELFRTDPYVAFERFTLAIEKHQPAKGLLLIMDEFDKLLDLVRAGKSQQSRGEATLGPDAVFQPETMGALRKMIMQTRAIRVVVAGLPRLRSPGYEDRFFHMLEEVFVGGFTVDEANQVIDAGRPVFLPTVAARDELLRASGGQPYLLQVICHELFAWMVHEGRDSVTRGDVREVLEQRVLPQLAIFSDLTSLLDEPRVDLIRTMARLHRESPWRRYVSLADIARELQPKGRGDAEALKMLLEQLMTEERPLVERATNDVRRYRLTIGVLGDHLLR